MRRGCLNSVRNATEVARCRSQSDTCKTCSGPFCNAKPSFQRCRVCNSTASGACIRSPGSFASQLCPDYMDECFTHVDADVVTRGCVSAIQTDSVRTECASDSDEFCATCSAGGASCNAQLVDGEFCYECDSSAGDHCGSGANFTMRKQCPLAVGRRGCYLFDDNGGTVKRGCVADLVAAERQMCRQSGSDTCKTCVGNDCNAKQTFQRCRHCDSRATVNCVRAAHATEAVLCERYDDECFVHIDANSTVTRGCLQQHASDQEPIREACADVAIDTCETCSAPGAVPCNQRVVDGEFCMRCDSAVDPSCAGQAQNHTARVQCPLSPIRRGCYHSVAEDGRVQRGCLADLAADEIDTCREDGAICKSCMGDDCNALAEFRRCRACSSLSSVSCIRSPNAFAAVTCMRYLDQCYTHVADDVVQRGCVKDWPTPLAIKEHCGANNTEWCDTCADAQSCNNRIVDGEFCLTCDSELDADCRTNQNYTMRTQCPLSVGQRGCYLFDDGPGGAVKRGCVADLVADERQMCDAQGASCKTCLGNDCNQKTRFQSCRTCSSAQSDNCIRSPQAFAAQQCRHYDDQCVTHVRNNTVTRGCLRQVTDELARDECAGPGDTEHCTRCERSDGAACNAAVVDGEFCLTCDSATDPNCRSNLNHTMRTQCPLSAQPRGCFRLDGADGHVRRGCVADLDEPTIAECRREGAACKTCVGNDCNAKVAFQQCRVCSSATSVNCIRSPGAFAAQTCRSYADECFVHVHDNVVTRGCLAEATTPAAVRDECRNGDGDMCQSCATGANCNNRVVDGEFCLACDSRLDPDCGAGDGGLNHTMREQCPLSVLGRGCYLNATADGTVTRGCVAQLPAAERLACREEGDQCKTCRGNDCNAKAAFEYCRTCSSASSVSCIRSPGAFASVLCRGYTDQCYTHVRDNVVTRGCLAQSMSTQLLADCSDPNADADFCQKCSGTRGCNNRLVDGEFCLTCDSAADPNCLANANYTMRTQCPLAVRPRGCYRHAYADGRIERGCVADIATPAQAEQCGRPGDDACKTCVGNDCNQEAGFAQCKQCSSVTDVDCFRGPRWVHSVTCPDYLDTCFLHVQNNTATRGCLGNATEPAVGVDCADGDGERCAVCRGADCNDQLLDGEFCLHCDSATDPRCGQAPDWTMRKQCDLSVQPRGCYRYDDGAGTVRRGCVSDIGAAEAERCRQQGDQCKTCVGDDCNARPAFQTCRVCNSTQSASCIRSPGAFAVQTCRQYDDVCYAHAVDDVVTRGCLAAAPAAVRETCETNAALCETCPGPGCNSKLVDGEFCMRCDSRVDANCHANLDHTLRVQCPLAVTQRGCYRQEVAGGHVLRGCVADFNATEAASCAADGTKCKTCIGNDCNAKVQFQQCKVCNSTENLSCIRNAAAVSVGTVLCERYTDECVTHVADDVIVRGCAAEQSAAVQADCRSNPDLCEKCTGEACNAKIVDGEFCLTCDSTTDPNCRLQMSIGMRTQCSLAVAPLGCFHRVNEQNGVVRRGCISDLSADEKAECRADGANCKICRGNDCNQRPDFPRCLACDSNTDPNCAAARNGTTAAIIATTADCAEYTDDCYTHLNGSHVRRGCVLEAEHVADIRSECARDERNCRLCRGANCNQVNVEPESCWECDSERQGVDCVTDLVQAKRCSAEPDYSFDRRGCFHQVSGWIKKITNKWTHLF